MMFTNLETSCRGRLPLCARYASVHFSELRAGGEAGPAGAEDCVLAGVGALDDGQLEFLGVWAGPIDCSAGAEAIVAELLARGLVGVRVFVGAPASLDAALLGAYSRAVVARSFWQSCSAGLSGVLPRDRSVVVYGMTAVRLAATYDDALEVLRALALGTWKDQPGAVAACDVALRGSRALYLLPQRLRRATHRAEIAVSRLHMGVQAALVRDGLTVCEAAPFAEASLTRAVHRLSRVPAPRSVSCASWGAGARGLGAGRAEASGARR